jgi:hypothetical protein
MKIRWHSESLFLETLREAEIWADSIANEMYARNYDGYITPDYKIAYVLAFRLASINEFEVRTEIGFSEDKKEVFRVWVVPVE